MHSSSKCGTAAVLVASLLCFTSAAQAQAPSPSSAPELPPAVAGIRLGGSFGAAGLRCINEGFQWTPTRDGGRCSQAPMSVGYPAWVEVRRCASRICEITVGIETAGETQLRETLSELARSLEARYGGATSAHDGDADCMLALAATMYSCLLGGRARYELDWPTQQGGLISLRAFGRAGARTATIFIQYTMQEGRRPRDRRAL